MYVEVSLVSKTGLLLLAAHAKLHMHERNQGHVGCIAQQKSRSVTIATNCIYQNIWKKKKTMCTTERSQII